MLSRLKERSLSSPYLLLTGLSLAIRLLTASLVVVLSSLLTPFDTSAVLASSSYKLAPFLTWDATFFFSIAEHSYTFEQQLAFGPALPALIRTGGHLVAFLACSSDPTPSIAHMVIGGTALAILAGTAATLALYRLTLSIFPTHPSFAFLSSLLFLLPPSPITLNAVPYTEPFFALTSFVGMEAAMRAKPRYLVAAAILGVGTLFRPQGIVIGVGLFGWRLLLVETRARGPFEISRALRNLPRFLFFTAISFLPFALYQYYAYTAFCTNATSPRPWCSNTLPMSYSWIQAHYWNVGFLNYYTPSQIPNFLFAAPPLLLTFFSLKSFYSHNPTLLSPATSSPSKLSPSSSSSSPPPSPFHSPSLLPLMHHTLFLTLLLLTTSHIQIYLRLFPTNPTNIWFVAHLLVFGKGEERRWGARWVGYVVVWGAVSVVLWTGFMPPA